MAESRWPTKQFTSEQFVESSGAILFDLAGKSGRVCLLHHNTDDVWFLAKGRRNCGETRGEAALREVKEETGFPCRLFPVRISTRAPGPAEVSDISDEARAYDGLTEPFMMTIRELGDENVKFIWWFIVVVDSTEGAAVRGEEEFTAHFLDYDEALRRLTYRTDRDVLQKAISLAHP